MTRHGGEARALRVVVIDDGNGGYSKGYHPHLEVVEFGEGLDRIGTWKGLIELLLEDGVPDFDLLLYDVNFDKDKTLSAAGTNNPPDSGGVRTLGMVMALAVMAGRRPSSGMPIAQSAFTAFAHLLEDDRGAIHTYGLLRALEDEPPAGIEADQVSEVLPGPVVEGIRRDLRQITTKDPSPSHEDLNQIMPSYRKHFLGRCDKAIIVLDEAALSEALVALRSIPPEATQESTERELDQIVLVVSHASGEEVLRLRSLFAERVDITGDDLFLKGEGFDYNAYHRDNETIDHAELGPGDFLELLNVVASQHRPLHPIVSQLLASIREAKSKEDAKPDRGGRDADRDPNLFHGKWTWVCELKGIDDSRQRAEVAFVALLFAYLEYLHADVTRRPHSSAKVTAVRQVLSTHEHFPDRYLRPWYNGSYQEIMRTEFKKGRLRPGHRAAGIAYWDELNKRYEVTAGLPDCLR